MSLANLSLAFEAVQLRARMAEDQLSDLLMLIGQFLIDGDPAARKWLVELAKEQRGPPQQGMK